MTDKNTDDDLVLERAREAGADPDLARRIYEDMIDESLVHGETPDDPGDIATSAVELATVAAEHNVDEEEVPDRRLDPLAEDFRIGDPVIDLATGRSMVVVEHLADRVDEYDGYDLLGNYAAQRTRVSPADPVIGCIYTSSIQSEPSGPRHGDPPYAFASSRLGRPTIESVEGYDRVYDLVARDVLERLMIGAREFYVDKKVTGRPGDLVLKHAALGAGFDENLVEEVRELAEIETEGP